MSGRTYPVEIRYRPLLADDAPTAGPGHTPHGAGGHIPGDGSPAGEANPRSGPTAPPGPAPAGELTDAELEALTSPDPAVRAAARERREAARAASPRTASPRTAGSRAAAPPARTRPRPGRGRAGSPGADPAQASPGTGALPRGTRSGRDMALWEDRSVPHPTAPPPEPRNYAETAEHIRGAGPNDPPRAPKPAAVAVPGRADRAGRADQATV